MATGGPSSHHPTATDCPLCGSLCLGPVILPCRDVICRKCLHDVLRQRGLRAACQQCGQRLNLPRDLDMTVSELAQQMGTDPVMDKVVLQELDRATDIPCLNCPNKEAANVCLDCQEYYCDVCSGNHCRSRMASDHVLHQLSQALQNVPSVVPSTPTPTPRPSSVMSTSSLSSIRNLPDPQSRDTSRDVKEWEEWVKKQLDLLRRASRDKLQVKTVVQEIVSLGQELLDRIQTDEQILDNYQHFLPRFEVIERTDPDVYVIQERGSGVRTQVRRQALEGRLCGVRECRHCPDMDSVEGIRTQLDQLLHLADQDSPDQTSTVSAGSPTFPTSAQLPPATPATTHTFTPSINVMTATPQRLFTTSPTAAEDRVKPFIPAIVCLPNDTLVMVDSMNDKVKMMDLAPPYTVSASLTVRETPWNLALLSDGLVAVTTSSPLIYLIKVTDAVMMKSRIKTVRICHGIAGQSDGRLLVSCQEDDDGPAAVHVLTRQGQVVRTVTDSTRLTRLMWPEYICDDGDNHVLVTDCSTDLVYRVEISSGRVTHTYNHTDLINPGQVCVDRAGVIYMASMGGKCVLVKNRGGQWRRLLTSDLCEPGYTDDDVDEEDDDYDVYCDNVGDEYSFGLCLTRTGRLVVTWGRPSSDSVVSVYDVV